MGIDKTMAFKVDNQQTEQVKNTVLNVYEALIEKGYNPVNQIVGYILSGDPTYITNHRNARSTIRELERNELLEKIVEFYLSKVSEELKS